LLLQLKQLLYDQLSAARIQLQLLLLLLLLEHCPTCQFEQQSLLLLLLLLLPEHCRPGRS
jgi:hypothetical protein